MPFGLRNSPVGPIFSNTWEKVLTGFEMFTGAYLDNIIIFSDTREDHLKHLRLVFDRIRQANLSLKKQYFCVSRS